MAPPATPEIGKRGTIIMQNGTDFSGGPLPPVRRGTAE
jgi:hypothetical protein